jgi:ATP phosphoribosyltransferase
VLLEVCAFRTGCLAQHHALSERRKPGVERLNIKRWIRRDPEKHLEIDEIATLLMGVIEARRQALLTMNVPAAALERVIEVLPAMKRPTLSRLHGIDYFSIQTVVQKGLVNGLIPALKAAGAEDILEIPITKIVR